MAIQEKLAKPVEALATKSKWARGAVAIVVGVGLFFGASEIDPDTLGKLVTAALGALAALVTFALKRIDLAKLDLPGTWDDDLRAALLNEPSEDPPEPGASS